MYSRVRYETTWFFTQLIFLRFFLLERVDPNKERYWKKIIKEHARLQRMYRYLERWDAGLLARLPWFRRHCWNLVVEAVK
jgi:hypothetical protein